MFIRLTPVLALVLLSGCTLTNGEQYHQKTLTALQDSEARITNKIENLTLQSSNQVDYIESLETQITELQKQVEHLQLTQQQSLASSEEKKPEPKVIAAPPAPAKNQIILGAIEKVTIESINQSFDARVDTGATTSSLNAVDIEMFERNGKDWVRFHLSDPEQPGTDQNWVEAPVIRYVKIRQSTNDDTERRAVVELWVKVGAIKEKAQFTLADRSQMSHPVLLGREFIRDIALVDVSRSYIQTGQKKK
ncbi:ATP-dependent zinc protease [Vibrio vulnificus]|uniref:ATP-dependent zinc protease family protein n=1 Tax=Vibrio vulnificus TaxID=672 RepID=UPI0019D42B3E|nr:ATP-dependent zinc protease [Vibrio vulnificus]EIO3936041.1 ATP-dependent zinc protease [Vibrio vulnificus]EKZ9055063.1 ATP-dependent zinc protease [Vibrio vulnificus]ELC9574083.1 ATP-dependent zinc protease [Vibrio vulnificus]ELV8585178.1 ATP-dependent zinc protease [Vibrio vulnificus]